MRQYQLCEVQKIEKEELEKHLMQDWKCLKQIMQLKRQNGKRRPAGNAEQLSSIILIGNAFRTCANIVLKKRKLNGTKHLAKSAENRLDTMKTGHTNPQYARAVRAIIWYNET